MHWQSPCQLCLQWWLTCLQICSLALLVGAEHAVKRNAQASTSATQSFAFDYAHHGEDWIMGSCGARERQSPIDFDKFAPWDCMPGMSPGQKCEREPLYYKYEPVEKGFTLQNNGHSLAADLMQNGYGSVTYNGMRYDIMSVNFHAQSEHTFEGRRLPLELHMVHKRQDADHVLILAIPFDTPEYGAVITPILLEEAGRDASATQSGNNGFPVPKPIPLASTSGTPSAGEAGFNANLQKLLYSRLPGSGARIEVPILAPADLLSPLVSGSVFFEYDGSLTAPPCTEQVTWLVRRNPLMASEGQANFIRQAIFEANHDFGNWRADMPLMNRLIVTRLAVEGLPPVNGNLLPSTRPWSPGPPLNADLEAEDAWKRAFTAAHTSDAIRNVIGGPPRIYNTYVASGPTPGAWPGPAPGLAPAPAPAALGLLGSSSVISRATSSSRRAGFLHQWRQIAEASSDEEDSSLWYASAAQAVVDDPHPAPTSFADVH